MLANKVIVVTASTRGIGRAIVENCAEKGATVYMAARDEARAAGEIAPLVERGLDVKFVYMDASKTESFTTMVEDVVAAEGRIDVLVNNFGTSDPRRDRDIMNTQVEDFVSTVEVNLRSVFMTSQAALPVMKEQGSGSIINIASVGGIVPDISQIAYGTSKAAIIHMTKMIATQTARYGVTCNVVAPGMIATDAVKNNLSDEFQDIFMKHTPIKRMGKPEEIAEAVAYFASDAAAYTTGQVLTVSGGFGMPSPLFGDFADSMTSRS